MLKTYGTSRVHDAGVDKTFSNRLAILVEIAALFVFLSLTCYYAHAQTTGQGSVSGTVTDSSDAVVAGASITVTNLATSVTYNSVTNSTGYFEVDNLNPGVYSISVTAP